MVTKMYVIPSTLYDSLLKRIQITENPSIAAQVRLEMDKDKLLSRPFSDPDNALAKLSNLSYDESVIRENELKDNPTLCKKSVASIETQTNCPKQFELKKAHGLKIRRLKLNKKSSNMPENFYTPPQEIEKTKPKRILVKKKPQIPKLNLNPNILERFYDFEPLVSNPEQMENAIQKSKVKSVLGYVKEVGKFSDSPRRTRSGKKLGSL